MNTVIRYISMILALVMAFCGIGKCEIGDKVPAEDVKRIMSFNVRYNGWDRGKIVPQLIADYYPDSVGVQECEALWYYQLKAFLPQYGIVGVGRLTGTRGGISGEMSAILYRKDKCKVVDSDTFWLSETPDKISKGWDAQKNRICTWAILEDKETGERYAHLNAHLDHQGENARKNGLALVLEKAKSFDMPVVITGDFNFGKGTECYGDFAEAGFFDAQDKAVDTMYGKTYHGYNGGEEGNPIDFIMVNDEVEDVKTYKIIRDKAGEQYISDHYPIYSDMTF